MHYSIRVLLSAILLIIAFFLNAQEAPKIIPPSPTAAALGKYGDIPVGLYTGIPNISIPICELKGEHLSLPISLSYHGGGVKVEENSSWIGLNWVLNAGGVITRTTRGLKDEGTGGYLINAAVAPTPTMTNYFNHVIAGNEDSEPDLFFFNFNGYSGKFFLEKKTAGSNIIKGYSIPYKDIQIICTYAPGSLSFTIKTEDGTEYIFGMGEVSTTSTFYYDTEQGIPVISSNPIRSAISAYYLTEIRSAIGGEVITLNYLPEEYKYVSAKRGSVGYRSSGMLDYSNMNYTETSISGARLSSIRFEKIKTTIEFKANKTREDLLSTSSFLPKAIEEILIKHDDYSIPLKKFVLGTGYFGNPFLTNNNGSPPIPANENYLFKRLRLDNIKEMSGDGMESKPPYVFEYNTTQLPPKNAETQDHWGFSNAPDQIFNSTQYYSQHYMVPAFSGVIDHSLDRFTYSCESTGNTFTIPNTNVAYLNIPGVNREPSTTAMKAGILTKIFYPTGGFTELEYEPHTYGYVGQTEFTKEIRQIVQPGAFIERPFENNPTGTEEQQAQFEVTRDALYKVSFDIEYSYKSQHDFENGLAYTRNEVLLTGDGLLRPVLKVYYDTEPNQTGNIYAAYWDESTGTALPITLPVPMLGSSSLAYGGEISDGTPDGPEYGRKVARGFYVVHLRPGVTYTIKAIRQYNISGNCPDLYTGNCLVNNNAVLTWVDTPLETGPVIEIKKSFLAGGLRIRRKSDQQDWISQPVVSEYSYRMHDAQALEIDRSSGCLAAVPNHFSTQYFEATANHAVGSNERFYLANGLQCGLWQQMQVYAVFTASSDYPLPLSTTQGSHISYREVQVTQPGNGFTLNKFLTCFDYPDAYPSTIHEVVGDGAVEHDFSAINPAASYIFPFVPKDNYDWKRGHITETISYGEGRTIKFKEAFSYTFINKKSLQGISVYYSGSIQKFGGAIPWADYVKYDLISGFGFLSTKTVVQYDENGLNPMTTITTNQHDSPNHIQLTKESVKTSEGSALETAYLYSADKPGLNSTPSTVFDQMVNKNILYKLVKKEVKRDGVLVNGLVNNFKLEDGNLVASNVEVSPNGGPYEVRLTYNDYNLDGKLLQYTTTGNIFNSYIYDYNNTLPIAEVGNATPSNIAYTSFESDGSGNWIISGGTGAVDATAMTGKRSFNLSAKTIQKSSLSASVTYAVSYCYKAGVASINLNGGSIVNTVSRPGINGWTFITQKFINTSSITLSGNVTIDELRLCPASAQMTTYSYDPQIGVTSSTDPNGITTYFEYDSLGRLKRIKDKDSNIIKSFVYHYRGH